MNDLTLYVSLFTKVTYVYKVQLETSPRCCQVANSTKQRCLTSDWCRHLGNWTKHTCHFHAGIFDPFPQNQKYTTYRIFVKGGTYAENLMTFGRVFFRYASGQTHKLTDRQRNTYTQTRTHTAGGEVNIA